MFRTIFLLMIAIVALFACGEVESATDEIELEGSVLAVAPSPTAVPTTTVVPATPIPTQAPTAAVAPSASSVTKTQETPVPTVTNEIPAPAVTPTVVARATEVPSPAAVPTNIPVVDPTATPIPTTAELVECIVGGYIEVLEKVKSGEFDGTGIDELSSKPRAKVTAYDKYGVAFDDSAGVPKLATASYVELDATSMVSKFRSHSGHDFSDSYEDCRTMKHYTYFRQGLNYGSLPIYSPIDGVVGMIQEEDIVENAHGGWQLYIVSSVDPSIVFRLFHMKPMPGVEPGRTVRAGELIGVNNDVNYTNDIAVQATMTDGIKFMSYFDFMSDEVFTKYSARGVVSRESAIISKEVRDAEPLACDGEWYVDRTPDFGDESAWITLN